MAGLLPHAAQRVELPLAAEPDTPPPPADSRPAGELRQQAAGAEEPAGDPAAGETQILQQMRSF